MIDAKEVMGNAQAVAVLNGLLTAIGRAAQYRTQLGSPVLAKIVLQDPQQTTAIVSMDLLMPVLEQRAQELIADLSTKDISVQGMISEIEEQLEKQFQTK